MMKPNAGSTTSLPASGLGSAAAWGSKRIILGPSSVYDRPKVDALPNDSKRILETRKK